MRTFIVTFGLIFLLVGSAKANFNVKGDDGFGAMISSQYQYVDNYLYSQLAPQSANQFELTSTAKLQIQRQRQLYIVSALLKSVKNNDFPQDSFTDYSVNPALHYKFSHNLATYLKSSILQVTENRGQGISYGQGSAITTQDVKQNKIIKTGALYGSEYSTGKIFIELTLNKMNYTTRRDYSALFDEANTAVASGFDYLLSGKSYLATELQYQNTKYENKSEQNKEQYAGLIGYKWESTAITKIEALVGYEQVSFSQKTVLDSNKLTWRLALNWHPLTQLKLNLMANRRAESSNDIRSSYRINEKIDGAIEYVFNNEINFKLQLLNSQNELIYTDFSERENQKITTFTINYQLNERFRLSANYQEEASNNSNAENNYRRSGFSLGFDVII